MTTLHDHQTYVQEHPFEKVPALALVDRVQEECNGSRRDALRFVAALRKPGRSAKFMATAAKLMRSTSLTKIELDALMEDQAGLTSYNEYQIFLVPGFCRPIASFDPNEAGSAQWDSPIVTVGCRWVLHYYKLLLRIIRKQVAVENLTRNTFRRAKA